MAETIVAEFIHSCGKIAFVRRTDYGGGLQPLGPDSNYQQLWHGTPAEAAVLSDQIQTALGEYEIWQAAEEERLIQEKAAKLEELRLKVAQLEAELAKSNTVTTGA